MARILHLGAVLLRAPFLPALKGVARRDLRALIQWLWFGHSTRDDPFPLFDADFYAEQNPDGGAPRVGALVHFLRFGAAQGRHPHPLFDTDFYLERYPDVRSAKLNPLVHFLRFGAAEGRDPHPLFDTDFYLERYPDVRSSRLNPLVHYLRISAARGCDPHPLFDTDFYRGQAPALDARAEPNALLHYLRQGGEGEHERQPHLLFHPGYYRDRNPDVARSGMDPLAHYALSGGREGRKPHPLFDGEAYLTQCPEARAEDANPLAHYLEKGAAQGLSPHPLFDAAFYLSESDEVQTSGENPLAHYVRVGAARGLRTQPTDVDPTRDGPREPQVAPAGEASPDGTTSGADVGGRDESSARAPAAVAGRAVLAFLALPRSLGYDEAAEDPSVVALRLFSALGWDVKAWSPVLLDDGRPVTRFLLSSGIEILTPPAWPSPAAALVGTRNVDAVLLDDGTDKSVLAPAMALRPRARLLLLERGQAGGGGPEALTAHVDGALGYGARPALRPSLDLKAALGPGATPLTEGVPSNGTEGWPGAVAERRLVGFLHEAGVRPNPTLSQRLTARARDTGRPSLTMRDIVVLSMNPWRYRYQRPQHLSVELGRRRWRVFYVDPDFLPESVANPFAIEESPADNVYTLRLRVPGAADIHAAPPEPRQVLALGEDLQELAETVRLRAPVLLLQAPFWLPITHAIEHSLLAYDCMDLYRAFPNAGKRLVALEDEIFSRADVVVFSSGPLRERMKAAGRTVLVRNACDFERFAHAVPVRVSQRPTVGYVGAIDRWFDVELLERCVDAHTEWDFVLIGSAAGLPRDAFRSRPNLHLRGEVDYDDVPSLVQGFDVCIVPFVDSALTRCVNPVKVYEYLAAGRPVVATALPELQRLEAGLVYLGSTAADFLQGLEQAMAESRDPKLCRRRRAWAERETWGARAEELVRALT